MTNDGKALAAAYDAARTAYEHARREAQQPCAEFARRVTQALREALYEANTACYLAEDKEREARDVARCALPEDKELRLAQVHVQWCLTVKASKRRKEAETRLHQAEELAWDEEFERRAGAQRKAYESARNAWHAWQNRRSRKRCGCCCG